ncbi:MAG: hypothetical protein NTX24_04920 [Candidatus Pacearchaeota archaeon]|nr:hypothetical protein [Candidatus Pacearchaeota archaeon]
MAKDEEEYKQTAEQANELIGKADKLKNKIKVDRYLKTADKLRATNPAEAGAMYARVGRVGGEEYSEYTGKARAIATNLALKHDRDGAMYVRSEISRKDNSVYAKKLETNEEYAEAGMAYFMAGNYAKSEEMMDSAKKTGNVLGAYKIMGSFLLKELASLKKMGLLGNQYEEKQQQGEEQKAQE